MCMLMRDCSLQQKRSKGVTLVGNLTLLKQSPPGGLEPPTFRLTAERANQLRHGGRGDLAHSEAVK